MKQTSLKSSTAPADPAIQHEELRVVRGHRTGATVAVAIHSTAAGPATGGCRVKRYPQWRDGVDDALRLSTAMTMKCALSRLPHGGGKTVAVLPEPPDAFPRRDLIADIADVIAALDGRYITGPDVGTDSEDMGTIHAATGGLAYCRPRASGGSGDSSAATARGVLASLRVALDHTFHRRDVDGLSVGVIGYGHVGAIIAGALSSQRAHVAVNDINQDVRPVVEAAGMTWWDAPELDQPLDILVPAATGGLLSMTSAMSLSARLVIGPANNQLADERVAAVLADRGVTWIPDVLASGGGVINAVSRERLGLNQDDTDLLVDGIGDTTAELLDLAESTGCTTLQAAERLAANRLKDAR